MQMAKIEKIFKEKGEGIIKKIQISPSFSLSILGEFKHIINRSEKKSKEICSVVANEEQKHSCQRNRNLMGEKSSLQIRCTFWSTMRSTSSRDKRKA